jgi:hypothetical protein
MSTVLIIEQVMDGGNRHLATVADESILIGREPKPTGIAIPSFAISGTHGQFMRYGYSWFYRDLGSTNGSWFNERQLSPGAYHLIKHGDYILLANTIFRLTLEFDVSEVSEDDRACKSVSVFIDQQYSGIQFLHPHTKRCEFGGRSSAVKLPENFSSNNRFAFNSSAAGSQIETVELTEALFVNGEQHNGVIALQDRDEVKCGPLLLIYSEGYNDGFLSDSITTTGTYVDSGGAIGGRPSKEVRFNSSFGVMPTDEDTGRFNSPAKTVGLLSGQVSKKKRKPEDLILIAVAGLLILIMLLLLFWFLFTQIMK